ncbi:MAG: L,D-transpeptidase family protein [Proteobacteria bacterium]|nr:L,D-transpeptidase family protein [Pseudomonadota bacterium]
MNRPRTPAALVYVRVLSQAAKRGHIAFGGMRFRCALGRSGIKAIKREGDGATPRGRLPIRFVLYRPDATRPTSALQLSRIRRDDGWCDYPQDRNYNRPVRLPYRASAERLWRGDGLYDVVVVLGHNDVPRVRNRGSAIFMHVARENFEPTEGCIALRARDLRRLLGALPRRSEIVIGSFDKKRPDSVKRRAK